MKDLPVRKPIRLKDYDYSQNGAYFITLCVKDRNELLGNIAAVGAANGCPCNANGRPHNLELSEYGKIADAAIQKIQEIYETVTIDTYVIMPNHIHMIVWIENGRAMRAPTIGTMINQFKGYVTKQIGFSLWQKAFHDHIICDEADYQNHWKYIDENPTRWTEDEYYSVTAPL